ncbi:MAG: uridine kinase, partial [Cyanobacteria bacterium P01_H01_bin.21]
WCKDVLTEAQHILPGAIVIVEGVFSSRDELAAKYDFRIWVDCPRQLRLKRGIERDGESYRDRWEQDWMPSEDQYVENHQPIDRADFVASGEAG